MVQAGRKDLPGVRAQRLWDPWRRKPDVRQETARVHLDAGQRGGRVAARGTRAAAGEATSCWVLGRQHTFGGKRAGGRIRAAAPRPRLDRGPHDRDRISLGRRAQRALGRDRGRVCPAQSRYHRHGGNPSRNGGKAGGAGRPDRIRSGGGPGRCRLCRKSGAAGWERHRPISTDGRSCRKRLDLLREAISNLGRLAIMGNVGNPLTVLELGELQAAARPLGLQLDMLETRRPQDIATALDAVKGRADARYVCQDLVTPPNRLRINTLALAARLPVMHASREFIEAAGLISYGPNFPDLYRRTADYVDKILRGAKPADLPVEQPTKFELVVNLTTAKALGIEVPPTLLARADEVIE